MTQPALFPTSGHTCPCCGEHSPTLFLHELNHQVAPGTSRCTTQRLLARHLEVDPSPIRAHRCHTHYC